MSKKKTPKEKKDAAYEKDHYTFAWNSPHGFQKSWKKKKNRVNRVVRRKSKALLHSIEGLSYTELSPEQDSFTDKLFRKGLQSSERIRKRRDLFKSFFFVGHFPLKFQPCVFDCLFLQQFGQI